MVKLSIGTVLFSFSLAMYPLYSCFIAGLLAGLRSTPNNRIRRKPVGSIHSPLVSSVEKHRIQKGRLAVNLRFPSNATFLLRCDIEKQSTFEGRLCFD